MWSLLESVIHCYTGFQPPGIVRESASFSSHEGRELTDLCDTMGNVIFSDLHLISILPLIP